MEDHDNTAAGRGEMKSLKEDEDDLAVEETTVTSHPVNKPGEAQHSEHNNESKGGGSENTSEPSATSERVAPDLTLVLIGDPGSIKIGPKNILLDHDVQTNVEQFSSSLYNLCGRHICVINMFDLQTKKIPLNQEIHAFLLLLPNDLNSSHYNSRVQWLEKAFGRGALSHLFTVVTHKTGETCESALKELKANTDFDEKRFHTCKKSMMDGKEIVGLLEKINVMVSENDPQSYSGMIHAEEQEGHLEDKSHEEERKDSELKTNEREKDEEEDMNKIKSDEGTDVKQSENSDDSTTSGGESEIKSSGLSPNKQKGCDPAAGEADDGKEVTSESSKDACGNSEEGDTHKDTNVKYQPDSANIKERTSDEDMTANKENISGNEEMSMKVSEEASNKKKSSQRETENLLGRLHLQVKLHQKLSPGDCLQLHPHVEQHHVTSEKELPHTFLHMLMMLDYRARYILVRRESHVGTHPKSVRVIDITEKEFSNLEALLSTSVDTDQTEQSNVHPMDVQMAVFHCSDSFLKQMMIAKLSQCQYALPLLVPDPVTMEVECPLWTFRQITKTWKAPQIKDGSNIVTMKSVPVCEAETPLVSFFRLGSLSVSKSQLMNTLINDRHSTFFHRNCPGSTKSRHLMDGVAEITWYCPAGKPNDAFNDCIAFCNLHGDALLIETQRDILIEKSSINVFLTASLQKHEESRSLISAHFKSQKPLICLCVDDSCGVVKTTTGKYILGLKDRSLPDITEQLKKTIREVLSSLDGSSLKTSFQLETMAELSGIRVDESDPACQKGKFAAMKIMDLLTKDNMDVSKMKREFLPCQGHLWHQWSKIHKELYHLRGDIENEKSKKQQELMNIRQEQCAASCSKLMELFTGSLSSLPPTEKEYFLKWTQILMDALSTDDLSSVLQSYDEKWSEVLALKNKHDQSDLLLRKQTELENISQKLQSATFGLEHIFREVGQIYEAHRAIEGEHRHTDWSKYPELAAQLMISGHPMELMDGDAGHVPLTWISSLLEEVIKKLGDQRVFVLSVLGIQSSGKSTMLNTMFGLQFAVSAGRCTKGAFMQLLKVSEEKKKDFKFDYVLVVDTEGLRALELEGNTTRHHDNELATFVVGLGNLTLINIFGENPSEMQDILQIVVQAFMRMKKVRLSPSCVFVHQNVTDVAAAERIMDGKRRLQEKLDQMAKLAAKEEIYNAECFSDVIEFDVQKDVKYCAQLWEGSPPMAPPNPGYSESIQELKDIILSKASESAGITLSQFKTKVQDLWNALLNENFVFSFKNTLEIAVYRKLEVQYGNWTWTLRSNMLTIENQLHNRIENGNLDKVAVIHLKKESKETYETIRKEMSTYFEDDKEKEIIVQWRGRFETKIKEFHDEQLSTVKRKLDEVIQQKKARKKLDDKKTEFENKLLQKSKELAQQLKDKAKDEEELQKHFSSVWKGWVTELTADMKPVEDINLEEDQFTVLQELGIEWTLLDESERCGRYKNMSKDGDYSYYVVLPKKNDLSETIEPCQDIEEVDNQASSLGAYVPRPFKDVWKYAKKFFEYSSKPKPKQHKSHSALSCDQRQQIRSLIDKVDNESLDAIRSKPVATRGYSSTYLQEVAKTVKEDVEKFQKERKYTLKKEFTVDLLLYLFYRAENWLLDSQKKFKMKNDALTYLESKKTQYYTVFRNFCKGNSSAVVLADLICEKLKASTVAAVCNKTAIDLAREMKCNFPAFNGNRLNLEKHVLKSLAENEDFNDFITYIRNPRRQTMAFIKEKVKKYIFIDHKDETVNILKKNIDGINTLVSQALFTATQKVQTQRGNTDMLLKEFFSLLKDELTFDTICSRNFSDINDFGFLKEEIKKRLPSIIDHISSLSLDKLKRSRLKADEILIDQLCRCCWVRCPFCAAVCTNTIKDHSPDDHSVPFHRPEGINGWHYRRTVEFSIDFCTTNMQSDHRFYPDYDSEETVPYKLYRTAGPKYASWRITPDESKLAYWKWFVCRFKNELEEHYYLKFQGKGEIPRGWKRISKYEAIRSLDEMSE